jgi:UDP-N-acetylmuramate--alanine ligase
LIDGISIHFEDDIHAIQRFYLENTLVIITPVPKTFKWNYFLERDFQVKKRAEVLGIIQDTFVLPLLERMVKRLLLILGHILQEGQMLLLSAVLLKL